MRAHLFQYAIAWEDREANFARVRELAAGCGCVAGDLLVLPEMFDTGFSFQIQRTADREGRTLAFLCELARSHGVMVHGARTLLDERGMGRNVSTIVSSEGEVIAEYEKIHPFTLGAPGEREADHFPGGREVVTYVWGGVSAGGVSVGGVGGGARTDGAGGVCVCPTICYDLRFPELFRRGLVAGAEMFVVPTNWPRARGHHLRALLIARAIENQAFVLCVNRVGRDPFVEYHGGSVAIGPMGEILGELEDGEGVLSVEIDRGVLDAWRARFPAWREHRLLSGDGGG
jgi:predicted amidohydrolase